MWNMEAGRIRFVLGANLDVLPCPQNLSRWIGDIAGDIIKW